MFELYLQTNSYERYSFRSKGLIGHFDEIVVCLSPKHIPHKHGI